jgi:gamma-glutamylcyclotransferase (GGCT)/AIG2-like uncharacterized protein YtfP
MKKPTEKTPYLFVYGTLMRDFGNHVLLKSSRFVDRATTEDNLKLKANVIPYLLEEDGPTYVVGELYEVSEATLKMTDGLEGHPTFYERKIINVINEMGDRVKAWVYFYRGDSSHAQEVKTGDYRDYNYTFRYQD